ncbi:transcriptional regulator, GntR family [Alteribacillus persepolensis]|uniref:Transcriptional regulator, GntR family n=1 Tax=Alteribacillus persepolensis TaxID=568899 RepID=A0A1G8FSP0_9BACI|nr:GntR family transcriptional regulator [Alteribacillus persepolensis]SDH85160.1 transcriptional regulator, GntR family [Alteribacillus persepolensis]
MNKNGKKTSQLHAYTQIRDKILNGEYEGGTKLTEVNLAESMGISRTPVREAIRRLEQEGLIKNKKVFKPTETDMRYLFEMRILIESYSAKKAARYMIDEQISQLRDCVHQAKTSTDTEEIIYQNKRFHDLIVKESRNPLMIENVEHMQAIIYLFSRAVVSHKRPFLVEEHEQICQAIADHNPEKAGDLMKAHLEADLEFALNIVT